MRAGTKHVLALLLTAMLIAAACSGSDGSSEDAAGADDSPTTTAAAAKADKPLEIDRSGRFSKEDTFCEPATTKDKEKPKATDAGITADEIVVTHLRVTLEQLAGIGFAVDIGDTADQSETFVKIINERCGGIHGRKIKLNTIDFPALPNDADVAAQRDCIRTAEDQKAVIAYSFTGAGGPLVGCLTAAHDVIFLTTYAITSTDIEQSEGRLFSVSTAPSQMMRYAVEELAKDLKGKRIGVVYQDTTGDPQIVQQGMLAALKEKGLNVVRADVLGCNNQPRCADGLIPSVQGMIADKVDVIFPLLNTITLPGYMAEMVTQGVKPKQFQFMNVGYFAQDGELVSGKIVEFGGKAAGALYDGAIIVSAGRAGAQRLPSYQPAAFNVMCNAEYAANSAKVHTAYDWKDDIDSNRYGATTGTCTGIRLIARAIDAAGVNPTRKDIAKAMANLGAIDLSGRVGSFTPDKPTAPLNIARVEFRYPCPTPVTNKGGNCMVPLTDYKPLPKIK